MRGTAMLTPRIRTLGAALRDARLEAHFGVRELARRVGANPALLSNWELGQRVPGIEDVAGILGALGVVGEDKQRILCLARGTSDPGWITLGRQAEPEHMAGLLACERAATSLVEWHPLLVPGLLQIPDYARALFASDGLPPAAAERQADARVARRPLVVGPRAVPFEALIGEAALYNPVGGAETMARQLRFIADLATTSPRLRVRIVRVDVGEHPGLGGQFTLYAMRGADPIVYFEHYSSGAFILDAGDVGTYRDVIGQIREKALSPQESVAFIERRAAEFRAVDRKPPQLDGAGAPANRAHAPG
ncbi:helix-turn-helix domain-containing protein [Amycolatopsis jiangsuensis]|uniref:Transcriptional regulator with XRE-family HTH domain n=1 Tax=Amycolatopsis jiangsuensis TaxID=1181879 RepID=A0A840J1W2_9PSEU|nr:helix-turn-helix transcriptional regulator [Amycolatopsis jiangsuensis]MBB4687477.1 transcriptional regulator with XRE-family HTH domain [Amycolatopsis jiangsuensis]